MEMAKTTTLLLASTQIAGSFIVLLAVGLETLSPLFGKKKVYPSGVQSAK
jgi:hypothetical protein